MGEDPKWSCEENVTVRGSARQEIVLLQPEGQAFGNYETGEFFTELLKKFSYEKDEEGKKQEYNARKQTKNEDPRKYFTDKMRLWVQAYPPVKRSLVEFKNVMLIRLYNTELRKEEIYNTVCVWIKRFMILYVFGL